MNRRSGHVALFERVRTGLVLLAMAAAVVPGQAFADTAPSSAGCTAVSAFNAEADTLKSIVGWMLDPFRTADASITSTANQVASAVMTGAYALGGLLAITYLLWATVKFVADGQDNYFAVVIETVVPVAIATSVLHQYSSVIGGIQGLFNSMGLSQAGGLTAAIANFGITLFNGLATSYKAEMAAIVCVILDNVSLSAYFSAVLSIFTMIFTGVLAAIALAELVGVMLFGSVLAGIGTAFGPYFIMAGITPWTRGYMEQWIGFIMAAFLYKSLISIVLTLLQPFIAGFTATVAAGATASTGLQMGAAITMVALMWILRSTFLDVPHIAAMLLGNGHAQKISAVDDAKAVARLAAGIVG